MNWFQGLLLGMSILIIVSAPFLLIKALRRKQKYRIVEMLIDASVIFYMTVSSLWPSVIQNAPLVHELMPVLFLLWILNFFGFFRWLFSRKEM